VSVHELVVISLMIFAAATFYSCVGHAGASAYLAVMALAGVDAQIMKPTALALNVLVALIASVRFYRAGCFSWSLWWPFAVTSIPGALAGGFLTLPSTLYRQMVGVVLLYAAYRLFRSPSAAAGMTAGRPPRAVALILGALIGLLSGLTGVGGGIFLSPILLLAGWADPRRTAGVSALFILVNSLAGLGGRLAALPHLPAAVAPWAVAAVVGGLLGSGLGSRRLGAQKLRRVLAVVLVVASVKLILV
jgi:uncharacterized membrane protein YfcA